MIKAPLQTTPPYGHPSKESNTMKKERKRNYGKK